MPPTWAAGTSIVEHVWAYSVRSHGRQTVHHRVDVIGPIELQLDAACTAPDTAFIAFLQDVSDDGNVTNITAGYLRAGLRKVDEEQSKQAAPVLPCDTFEAVLIDQNITYRIPLVPNARRFRPVTKCGCISRRTTTTRTCQRHSNFGMLPLAQAHSTWSFHRHDCHCRSVS
jgi:hypothetical protein